MDLPRKKRIEVIIKMFESSNKWTTASVSPMNTFELQRWNLIIEKAQQKEKFKKVFFHHLHSFSQK
jgi:hypothetical protein